MRELWQQLADSLNALEDNGYPVQFAGGTFADEPMAYSWGNSPCVKRVNDRWEVVESD